MEEALYKNETQLDRRLASEGIRGYHKVLNQSSRVFWAVVAAILLLVGLYLIIFEKVYVPAYILFVLCLCLLFAAFRPRNAGRAYHSMLDVNPSGQYHFSFFADHFEEVTPVSRATLSYAKVTKVIETQNAYALLFGVIPTIVGKANFQKSAAQDTGEFLREKCANARFYKKF